VLTSAGCANIEKHGGRVEPMPILGSCKLTADCAELDLFAQRTSLHLRVDDESNAMDLAESSSVSRLTLEHCREDDFAAETVAGSALTRQSSSSSFRSRWRSDDCSLR